MLNRRQLLLGLTMTGMAWGAPGRADEPGTPWVVAHRGATGSAPENTLAAFARAVSLGCQAYELDIHLTADQDLAVIHDDTLQRTSHKEGEVGRLTLAQLQQADPSIPSLRQALRLTGDRCRVLVEIKHPHHGPRPEGIERVLLRQLREEGMLGQVLVICFEAETIKRLRSEVPTGLLCGQAVDLAWVRDELGADFICPQFRLATPAWVEQAHDLGLRVNAWTVNEERDMRALIEAGCDAITTDRPQILSSILRGERS